MGKIKKQHTRVVYGKEGNSMYIDWETIITIGKVISAILVIIGVPVSLYKLFKKWNKELFDRIDSLDKSLADIKKEVDNLKQNTEQHFNNTDKQIEDIKDTHRVFYQTLNTVIEVMYRHNPNDDELDKAKHQVIDNLIDKA
jgi:uncharacterized membrane-anchored protein YhcB (DUF1043 family)